MIKNINKNDPLVSIVIPVYNDYENYLAELIESIDQQSYLNIEVIIVDDASVNAEHIERLKVLEKIVKKYPLKVFFQTKNTGPAGALNLAIKNSNGVYIKYCSHDDRLPDNSLGKMIEYFNKYSDTDILFTDIIVFGLVKDRWHGIYGYGDVIKKDLSDLIFLKLFMNKIFMGGPFCLIKRSVFHKIGNFNPNIGVEDWEFFLRVLDNNIIVKYLEEPLYAQRKHDKSLSKNALYNLLSRYKTVKIYQNRIDLKNQVAQHYVDILEQLLSLSKKEFWNTFIYIATDKELGYMYLPKLFIKYPSLFPSLFFRLFINQDSQTFKRLKNILRK